MLPVTFSFHNILWSEQLIISFLSEPSSETLSNRLNVHARVDVNVSKRGGKGKNADSMTDDSDDGDSDGDADEKQPLAKLYKKFKKERRSRKRLMQVCAVRQRRRGFTGRPQRPFLLSSNYPPLTNKC